MDAHELIVRRLAFPVLGRLYNPQFQSMLRLWEETQYWDPELLEQVRWTSFKSLLAHSIQSVPFYGDYFRGHGLTLDDFRSFGDLPKLPVLAKDDFHTQGLESFISDRTAGNRRYRDSTSGTSGRPFAFFIDDRVVASRTARLIRENRWANWQPGTRYVRLWGPHEETWTKRLFYDRLMRRVQVPAFGLQRNADHVFALFDRLKPRIIEAYTSAAVDLAILCRDRKRKIPPPESIIVSAETLTPQHRNLIEESLGGRVYNRYGSREFGNIAHECDHGSFHINAESFYLEEEEHPDIPGAKNLLVTFFDNYTMPFIRYRIGDLCTLGENRCDCGRLLPLVERVEGRETDFFRVGTNRSLSFLFFNHFFEQFGGLVDRYQVEQTAADTLLVRLVPTLEFSNETLQAIDNRLQKEFGGQPRFDLEIVDKIPRETSGKLRVYKPSKVEARSEDVTGMST